MQLPVSLIDALTEYKQDLRKIGFHAKIERIEESAMNCATTNQRPHENGSTA